MLGKLYITANSSTEKLGTVNELVIEAMDGKVASEASSKTALNKLHLAIGKALGEAGKEGRMDVREAVEPDAVPEDGAIALTRIEEPVEATPTADESARTGATDGAEEPAEDSILDELLDEEDEL